MVSLDGYVEDPDGGLDWSSPDNELHQHFNDQYITGEIDTSLYGRNLYETMAGYWPDVESDPDAPAVEREFSHYWKKIPKIVYSNTLEKVEWNSTLVREVNPVEIDKLKRQPGNNIDIGGAGLASAFMRAGLIDEFRLYVHPVILGGGKPMFPLIKQKLNLRHIETHIFGSGVVLLRYEPVNN